MTFIAFAALSSFDPNANMLVMMVIATLLLMYIASTSLLYNKWYLSILEMLYLLNLIILGGAFLFCRTFPKGEYLNYQLNSVTATSVSIALLQFVGTLIFQFIKQIWSMERIKECFKRSSMHEKIMVHYSKKKQSVELNTKQKSRYPQSADP